MRPRPTPARPAAPPAAQPVPRPGLVAGDRSPAPPAVRRHPARAWWRCRAGRAEELQAAGLPLPAKRGHVVTGAFGDAQMPAHYGLAFPSVARRGPDQAANSPAPALKTTPNDGLIPPQHPDRIVRRTLSVSFALALSRRAGRRPAVLAWPAGISQARTDGIRSLKASRITARDHRTAL